MAKPIEQRVDRLEQAVCQLTAALTATAADVASLSYKVDPERQDEGVRLLRASIDLRLTRLAELLNSLAR